MKSPEWLKELRAWLVTVAILGLPVLGYFYLKHAEADRRERDALLKSVQETTPKERIEILKKAAKEWAALEAQSK